MVKGILHVHRNSILEMKEGIVEIPALFSGLSCSGLSGDFILTLEALSMEHVVFDVVIAPVHLLVLLE